MPLDERSKIYLMAMANRIGLISHYAGSLPNVPLAPERIKVPTHVEWTSSGLKTCFEKPASDVYRHIEWFDDEFWTAYYFSKKPSSDAISEAILYNMAIEHFLDIETVRRDGIHWLDFEGSIEDKINAYEE